MSLSRPPDVCDAAAVGELLTGDENEIRMNPSDGALQDWLTTPISIRLRSGGGRYSLFPQNGVLVGFPRGCRPRCRLFPGLVLNPDLYFHAARVLEREIDGKAHAHRPEQSSGNGIVMSRCGLELAAT